MSTTIESLQVEVESNATSAVSGIEALASSLTRLKSALKGGVGLTAVVKQLTNLNNAMMGVSGTNADNLNKLAQGLQTLSTCGNIKLSSSVSTQITNIGNAVKSLTGTDFSVLSSLANALTPLSTIGRANLNGFISQLQRLPQALQALNSAVNSDMSAQITRLVSALAPLSQLGRNNLTSFVTQLQRLPEVARALESVNWAALEARIRQLVSSFAPLATQMQSIANGFSALPGRIQRVISSTNRIPSVNNRAAASYTKLAAKIGVTYIALMRVSRVVGSWITKSNEYQESLNLFTASMGKFAEEAKTYAESVADIIGIDPSEWLRNQGVFMTLATGFGVVSDRAYTMSQNLTQLGYDLSSFFNISFADSMQKLQSGIAGELEPLRRLGYDLSVARLQQEALNLGITKSVTAMTQAEKAELRYYAIMTQVTVAQGDMARTLEAPANQLRILKAQLDICARSLGNIFIPALTAVLPYAIAFVKAIRMIADAIASLFGFTLTEIDYSGLTGAISSADDVTDSLGDATKQAKDLKNALLGIDELNVISPQEDSSGSGSGASGVGLDFELPSYDIIGEAVNSKVDEIMKKLEPMIGWVKDNIKEILAVVGAIGATLLAWRIAPGLINLFDHLSKMKGFNILGSIGFKITGLGLFLDAWNTMKEAIQDIMENGFNFTNVTKLISGFAEGLSAALLALGRLDIAAPMLIISGLAGMASAISDIANNGLNWDNAMDFTKNLGFLIAGAGLWSKNHKALGGIGLMISGVSLILENLKALINGFKTGDFKNVNWIEVTSGALMLVGGLIIAFKKIEASTKGANLGGAKTAIDSVKTATEGVSGSVGQLSTKLTSLAKNLGMGLVIVAEVAAAALLITGAIILLGKELEQVGIAWEPVIANGDTVATAMGLGVGVLTAIGVVTALLGSVGTPLIVNIALGVAILAELGVAAGLFLVEIWAIGKGLDEIGKAWQPVLDNGETIAKGIGLGTALLVGIGVVTAALGVATVASAGLLPLAIGIGTALLVELAVATVLFIESLVAVANSLGNDLAPVLEDLNEKLPGLTTDMSDFVDFMTAFAGEVVRYTKASTVAGLSGTIDTIIGWFTQDPIKKMSNDVDKIARQTSDLNEKLNIAVPELETAVELMREYVDFIDELGVIAGSGGTVKLSEGLKVNLKTVGEGIVTGFNDGIKNKYSTTETAITNWGKDVLQWFNKTSFGGVNEESFASFASDIVNGFKDNIASSFDNTKSSITSWGTNIKTWFTSRNYGGINKDTFVKYATDIVNGFKSGIVNQSGNVKRDMLAWGNDTQKYFTDIVSYNIFYNIAKDVVKGFNNGINDFYSLSRPYMSKWANDAEAAFKLALDSNSPSKVFEQIGEDTILGYNLGIAALGKTTKGVVNSWADSFTSVNPVMSLAVDTSALKYYSSESFAKSIPAGVTANSAVTVTGFIDGMEEFYMGYVAPTLSRMADDVRRQADKNERTVVQVGNRVVTDVVAAQQKANGYAFAK